MLSISTAENLFQLAVVLAIFVVVILMTYYTTKWIAGYQKNHIRNRNFKVIETMKVAPNKFLQIVQVGRDEFYVIGIGKEEISMLGKLTQEQLLDTAEDTGTPGNGFSDILKSFRDGLPKGQSFKK